MADECRASISGDCLNMTMGFSFVGCIDECELRFDSLQREPGPTSDKPVRRARRPQSGQADG